MKKGKGTTRAKQRAGEGEAGAMGDRTLNAQVK